METLKSNGPTVEPWNPDARLFLVYEPSFMI